MIGLVFIDVDGTLVGTGGRVSPRVWEAATRARAAGVRIALCSGRAGFGTARNYASRLDGDGFHVFQNGASVLKLPEARSLSTCIAPDVVATLIAQARATANSGAHERVLELYTDTEYAIESTSPRARAHAELLGVPFATRPLDSLTAPIVRAQWLVAHADAEATLAESPTRLEAARSTSPVMPDTSFVMLTAKGVGKGSAMRAVAKEYGTTLADAMFVGDGSNDVLAMGEAGIPVAMGNAVDEVKRAARHHVASVDDGGVADALALAMNL